MKKIVFLILAAALLAACGADRDVEANAPVAKKVPHVTKIHGYTLTDNYFWMRDRGSVEVMDYIEAENDYTEAMTKHIDKLFREMKKRLNETDITVPEKEGSYLYYSRIEKGSEYRIYCRKKDEEDAEEEILLDVNILAEGHDYYNVGLMKISPDEQKLAYTYDIDGSENYRLAVKDLSGDGKATETDMIVDGF